MGRLGAGHLGCARRATSACCEDLERLNFSPADWDRSCADEPLALPCGLLLMAHTPSVFGGNLGFEGRATSACCTEIDRFSFSPTNWDPNCADELSAPPSRLILMTHPSSIPEVVFAGAGQQARGMVADNGSVENHSHCRVKLLRRGLFANGFDIAVAIVPATGELANCRSTLAASHASGGNADDSDGIAMLGASCAPTEILPTTSYFPSKQSPTVIWICIDGSICAIVRATGAGLSLAELKLVPQQAAQLKLLLSESLHVSAAIGASGALDRCRRCRC